MSTRYDFVPAPLAQLPWRIILLVIAIGSFGLVVLYSAAGGGIRPWALPQGIRFFAFLAGAVALSRVRESVWSAISLPAYGVLVLMLVGVELLGAISGGSQRWLDLGIIRLQPSELMKPCIVLAIAKFYDMLPPNETRRFGAVWPAGLLIAIPAALVMKQPDLGTALMITAGGITVMFLAGVPLRLFIGGGDRACRRRAAGSEFRAPRLSTQPHPHLPQPRKRSARHRLPHQPVEDRDRLGRRARQRLPQRDAEPSRLSARGPYRFRAGDDDGGMGD